MAIEKDIKAVTEADLLGLIDARVRESKTIEFKREITRTDEFTKKLLGTVASFANTEGGDIVFGIVENDGVATSLQQLPGFNPDGDLIRLRDLIRAHIEPKVYGFALHPVELSGGGHALVLRVPKTWSGAHLLTYGNDHRFYTRDGNGRRLMDVGEVRMAFSSADALPEKIRRLRLDRASAISTGDVPLPLVSRQALVVHLIPAKTFDSLYECDLASVVQADQESNGRGLLTPIKTHGGRLGFDFDGCLEMDEHKSICHGYTKLFRNGLLESLDCHSVKERGETPEKLSWFSPYVYEEALIGVFPKWINALKAAKIEPPIFLAVSLIGMNGKIPYTGSQYSDDGLRPIRHDPLLLQPRLIESLDDSPKTILRPVFDLVWNACGWPRSINFDEKGNLRSR
jgi:hypothetical protein